jgi:hypothetical protein
MNPTRKIIAILSIVMIVQAAFLATHEGEFWPFSIYPMFSKAGREWTRVVVRDVSDLPPDSVWRRADPESLPGQQVALRQYGGETIDASDFVNKTANWTDSRRQAFVKLLGQEKAGDAVWLVFRVRGHLTETSVVVTAEPLFLIHRGNVVRAEAE